MDLVASFGVDGWLFGVQLVCLCFMDLASGCMLRLCVLDEDWI